MLRAGLAARARVTGALPLGGFALTICLLLACLARVNGDLPLGCLAARRLCLACFWFWAGYRRAEGRDARVGFFFLDFAAFKSFPLFCLLPLALGKALRKTNPEAYFNRRIVADGTRDLPIFFWGIAARTPL